MVGKYYSAKEIYDITGCSERKFYYWRTTGYIKSVGYGKYSLQSLLKVYLTIELKKYGLSIHTVMKTINEISIPIFLSDLEDTVYLFRTFKRGGTLNVDYTELFCSSNVSIRHNKPNMYIVSLQSIANVIFEKRR